MNKKRRLNCVIAFSRMKLPRNTGRICFMNKLLLRFIRIIARLHFLYLLALSPCPFHPVRFSSDRFPGFYFRQVNRFVTFLLVHFEIRRHKEEENRKEGKTHDVRIKFSIRGFFLSADVSFM